MTHTTIQKLQLKAQDKGRMPSIKEIATMLSEFGIPYYLNNESVNVVEYRSAGRNYVNSRHDGKVGKLLKIKEANIELDSSCSYYSWNTWIYARKILDYLASKNLI